MATNKKQQIGFVFTRCLLVPCNKPKLVFFCCMYVQCVREVLDLC